MNEMSAQDKKWIDEASYEQLLRRWRFAPTGDGMFQGATGIYYQQVLDRKRKEISVDEHVRISKVIGWDRNENR
jgi:hypothetical protein